jgi:hypothetical protein
MSLGISFLAASGPVAAIGIDEPGLIGDIFAYIGSIMGLALILGFGTAWAIAATRRNAMPRRSPFFAWPLVLIAALTPLSMAITQWPLRLVFSLSRPALGS